MGVAALFALGCQKNEPPSPEPASASGKAADTPAMPPAPSGDNVHCLGVHECKGKSECHVAGGHACVGQNECKGKGWISLPKADCVKKGGTILEG
jgi:hypothetical protein